MDKAFHHDQSIQQRTACAHIRRVATHMDRSERLAVALLLIYYCFNEADKLTGLVNINLEVKGSQTFNEKAVDIRLLFPQLPTRSLAELAIAILLPEVSFIPSTRPTT
jgi:hypothetical protein